ncbi:uncharacterized protein L969DRAFT_97364 [Mixia osmundae IAM 14324]|uniref:Pre-mRNA-splicing factor SYF2 n=1 Tax=Mixia osmundae (strain CBS 9802 / IAM 14324 / JCM 22182 / KY 12970) TaxID=764103 RepID=G7DV20_MIXOS|nr:uncharacterized protein L969DRAFT_97364 [Mixia osmundae IAM 14324]KEI36353.1 hypothetical protein L969DRAFT_97364 [Mixia osmundae IAM 14324]GAA94430.1 hypothetical protein E5Q_01082 [Mixia osmundae IAM 14324]
MADASEAMEARRAKLDELKQRMSESALANRKDVQKEHNAQRTSAKESARLERKRLQALAMGEKMEARETGEDLERKRNWDYSIEDNENWDKKQKHKKSRANFQFTEYDDASRRKYKRDIDALKPDLKSYNAQRAAAMGTIIASTSGDPSGDSAVSQKAAAELLYRDANSFVYADHKPTEDAIDTVISKMNLDMHKRKTRSRRRAEDEDAAVTYINDKNKVYNKKLERFYNAHTKELRDNFERGTAL